MTSPSRRTFLTGFVVSNVISPGTVWAARRLVVASKSDTEGSLAGAMIALLLEHLGLSVERRLGLGPTLIVRSALKRHESRGLHFILDYPQTDAEARDTELVP